MVGTLLAPVSAQLPVHLPPVPDAQNQHQEHVVLNGVDDAVVARADAIESLLAAELLDTRRSGTAGERLDPGVDPLLDVLRKQGELPLDAGEDLYAVSRRQLLEAQPFAHSLVGDRLQSLALHVG